MVQNLAENESDIEWFSEKSEIVSCSARWYLAWNPPMRTCVALDTVLVAASPSMQAISSMEGDEEQQEDWASSRKNELPSFTEVLLQRTKPPIDLFMF